MLTWPSPSKPISLPYFAGLGYWGSGPTRKNAPSRSAGSCPSTSQSNNSISERLTPPPALPPPPNACGSVGKSTAASPEPGASVPPTAKPAPATAAPVRKLRRPTLRLESRLLESVMLKALLCRTLAAPRQAACDDRTRVRCVSERRSIGGEPCESICARLSRHQSDDR